MRRFKLALLVVLLSAIFVTGCASIDVNGDVKTSSTSVLFRLLFGGAGIIGAGVCWYFRRKEPLTWIGVVGLPFFALFFFLAPTVVATVDPEHFELSSLANNYSYRFDDISRIEVEKHETGVYRKGTQIVEYHVVLHMKSGNRNRIETLGDQMKPLWPDVVKRANAKGISVDDPTGVTRRWHP